MPLVSSRGSRWDMIGNDVVDLQVAAVETNWRRKGFLEKVFSVREREILSLARDPHQMVWLLWSMKEAAYKARQRQLNLPRSLNWHSLECRLVELTSGKASGEVIVEERKYFTASEITSERIHTSAGNLKNSVFKNVILEQPSEVAKKELLRHTADSFFLPVKELVFTKNQHGIPYISYKNQPIFHSFSFSDHGRFSAFSLSLIMS